MAGQTDAQFRLHFSVDATVGVKREKKGTVNPRPLGSQRIVGPHSVFVCQPKDVRPKRSTDEEHLTDSFHVSPGNLHYRSAMVGLGSDYAVMIFRNNKNNTEIR
ncbi:hypothetical protein TNCV_3323271 [Trichonephila clavipes]|nr:hypothetical protein TNCV_3323271 [Trichonephila clavipes]